MISRRSVFFYFFINQLIYFFGKKKKYNIFNTKPKLRIVFFENFLTGVFCVTEFASEVKI